MNRGVQASQWRYAGALSALPVAERASLLRRMGATGAVVRERTADILRSVRQDGDAALRKMAREYDSVSLTNIEVPEAVRRRALTEIEPAVRSALDHAARNIDAVHSAAPPQAVEIETEPGVIVGRRPDPLQRVGIYSPGGRAAYASSVLMAAIPARAAGVSEMILCTPPQRDGYPSRVVLAACEIARVDRVFSVGGAGAIAAMAYGTATIPRVDRIVGPGNAYVAEAKLQVSRDVGIDSPAGPSELLVICDANADVDIIAREVLAQAEHDVNACVVVLALNDETAASISDALARGLSDSRWDAVGETVIENGGGVASASLARNGAILTVESLADAVSFANDFAPEHLLLAIDDADRVLPDIRNAGCVFVGESSSVVFGDYITGGNHVLPTGGLARSYSGLGPLDFVRWTSYQKVTREGAQRLARDTAILARAERLPAHAAAALGWSGQC